MKLEGLCLMINSKIAERVKLMSLKVQQQQTNRQKQESKS